MIIRRIEMINFRGFRKKTIDFKDKSVVLFFGNKWSWKDNNY